MAEISCVASEPILNVVSPVPTYFLSGLLDADSTDLYITFAVKHLLWSRHSALFLQLHP